MSRKLIELIIDEAAGAFGIEAISLVAEPAIEVNWVAFNKQGRTQAIHLAAMDEEQRTIIGPALIPDLKIVRYDAAAGEEYDVYFSKETCKLASELYLKTNKNNTHTFEHEEQVEGVHVVESWLVQDPKMDKANLYGFNDLNAGTWMVRAKVENDEMWEKIKTGEARGLSIEGFFLDKIETMSKQEEVKKEKTMMKAIYDAVVGKQELYSESQLSNGKTIVTEDEALDLGAKVYTHDDKGEPMELDSGRYTTQAGLELEVNDGVITSYAGETLPSEEAAPVAAEPVDMAALKKSYYKHLLQKKYLTISQKNVTLSTMKQTALNAQRDAQSLVDDSFDTWGETGEALSYAIGDVALEVFPELDSQVYDCLMDAAEAAEKGDWEAIRDHLAKAYDYADPAVQTYIDVLITAVGTQEQYS